MTRIKPTPAVLGALMAFLLCAAASFWITGGVAPWERDRANLWHHYEYLAEGFLHGHTYLSVDPAPELARLADPYDPSANEPYRLWDASLYQGRYYLYYGPTPALALMAPWRALTGHTLPQRTAVALFACIAMAALARLLWEVRSRYFPGVSAVAFAGVLIVAFHASWLPVTLRRPGVWELPIVAADACLFTFSFTSTVASTGWSSGSFRRSWAVMRVVAFHSASRFASRGILAKPPIVKCWTWRS